MYITWIGVIDNGEGDDSKVHSPEGNLHLLLFDCNGNETSHSIIKGPSKNEFLDGDQSNCQIYIGTDCISYVKIYESDKGGKWLGRAHDVLFEGIPNSPGIWESRRTAQYDARVNAKRRGATDWLLKKNIRNGRILEGIPSLFLEVSCY